jgi:hypothetical protein
MADDKEKKVATTVYLTARQVEQLKALNRRTRVPVAEYIRDGVDVILRKHSDKLPGQKSFIKEED